MKEARYYRRLKRQTVACTACDRHCVISDGATGVCGVRANHGGKLYSLVYGNVIDAYADYIEKKKLAHVLPGHLAFSIGTLGCNFFCDFCLNWNVSQASRMIKEKLRSEGRVSEFETTISTYGYELSPAKVIDYCRERKYAIIAFTYNEPTVFVEYAIDIARLGRRHGIKSVFITNGYLSEDVVPDIAAEMDAVAIDLKGLSEEFYRKHCKASLRPVVRNIDELHRRGIWMELTTLIIPGENDSSQELKKIAQYIASMSRDIPWHITQFTPDYKLLDKPRTPDKTLYAAYDIAKAEGLNYVYFGNRWDSDKTSTYCPSCGTRLIFRDVYAIRKEKPFADDGTCRSCGTRVPGVWN